MDWKKISFENNPVGFLVGRRGLFLNAILLKMRLARDLQKAQNESLSLAAENVTQTSVLQGPSHTRHSDSSYTQSLTRFITDIINLKDYKCKQPQMTLFLNFRLNGFCIFELCTCVCCLVARFPATTL